MLISGELDGAAILMKKISQIELPRKLAHILLELGSLDCNRHAIPIGPFPP